MHLLQFCVGGGFVNGLGDWSRSWHQLGERGDECHECNGVEGLRAQQAAGRYALDPLALLRLGNGLVDDALLQKVQFAGLWVRLLFQRR